MRSGPKPRAVESAPCGPGFEHINCTCFRFFITLVLGLNLQIEGRAESFQVLPAGLQTIGVMSLVNGWEHRDTNMWLNFVNRLFSDQIL